MTPLDRAGFTLVELLAAFVLVMVVAVFMVGSSRIAAVSARRATLEIRAAQLIQEETERLRTLPYDSVQDGSATGAVGWASWTVTDSGSYRRAQLIVATNPLRGVAIVDTVYVYRSR